MTEREKDLDARRFIAKVWPAPILQAWERLDLTTYKTRDVKKAKAIAHEFLELRRDVVALLASYGWLPRFCRAEGESEFVDIENPAPGDVAELLPDERVLAGVVLWRRLTKFEGPIPNVVTPINPTDAWRETVQGVVERIKDRAKQNMR
jgi:hypothetical protein